MAVETFPLLSRAELVDLLAQAMEDEDFGAAEEYQAALDERDGLNG